MSSMAIPSIARRWTLSKVVQDNFTQKYSGIHKHFFPNFIQGPLLLVLLLLQALAFPSWLEEQTPMWKVVVSHWALQCNSVNAKITRHLHARSTPLGIYSQEFVLLNCMSYWHIETCSVEVRVKWHWGWPVRKTYTSAILWSNLSPQKHSRSAHALGVRMAAAHLNSSSTTPGYKWM